MKSRTLIFSGCLVIAVLLTPRDDAWAGAGQSSGMGTALTEADVRETIAVHDTSEVLQVAAIAGLRQRQPCLDEPGRFLELMQALAKEGLEAEKTACRQHGRSHATYRQTMKRMIAVNERLQLEEVVAEIEQQLAGLEPLDEAQLQRLADQSMAETEAWLEKMKEEPSGGGAKQGRDAAPSQTTATPGAYAESLEHIVAVPQRERHRAGKLDDDIRAQRQRRRQELSAALAEMERRLTTPEMRQAELDRDVVLRTVDRDKLRVLKTGLVEGMAQ